MDSITPPALLSIKRKVGNTIYYQIVIVKAGKCQKFFLNNFVIIGVGVNSSPGNAPVFLLLNIVVSL